jgi:glycosyltransferase involved in cell wall biosynthesis
MLVKNLITRNFLIKKIWIFLFEKKNLINASAIQASTNYESMEIKRFNFYFPKIFVIPNGIINPAYFKYPKEKKVIFKKKYKNILFIGRLNWKKKYRYFN